MAKYRTTDVAAGQGLFLDVNLKKQLLPDTFEYMLNEIIGTKIDLDIFDKNYKNDQTGASAVPPAVLLKLIIYGYSKGCMSSRMLDELNKNNIVAKALTGDMSIHWTTIADFISKNSSEFKEIFMKVLVYCNELGLIGGEIYAIDGLRLPSNASKEMSGTKKQLEKRMNTYKRMAEKHLSRHQKKDERGETNEKTEERFIKRQKYLSHQMEKIDNFLKKMEPKKGKDGRENQSNVTDNESAMIHSTKGYLQGYIGIVISDEENQIITTAQAVGTTNEGEHLRAMLDKNGENLKEAGVKEPEEGKKPSILGDPNYFSEDNLKACEERGIEAVIASGRVNERPSTCEKNRYASEDFKYHEEDDCFECPQGKLLRYKYNTKLRNGEEKIYQASLTDCRQCPAYSKCILTEKDRSELNQGKKILIHIGKEPERQCSKMRKKLETEEYQTKYSRRIQIVEPVFANISYCKKLNRFTLRGNEKVNGQWQLYCMVHNLGKCLNELNRRRATA